MRRDASKPMFQVIIQNESKFPKAMLNVNFDVRCQEFDVRNNCNMFCRDDINVKMRMVPNRANDIVFKNFMFKCWSVSMRLTS